MPNHINKLNQDSEKLNTFIKELKQKGNVKLMEKIIQKKEYLDTKIAELQVA